RDLYQQGRRGVEAVVVVTIGLLDVVGRTFGAGASAARGHMAAVVEVPDLVRESDVVRMRRPGHAGLLRARAVFGVEVVRQVLADGAVRLVLDLPEAVRRARGHEARLACGQVVQVDAQTVRSVLHGPDDAVARIHE